MFYSAHFVVYIGFFFFFKFSNFRTIFSIVLLVSRLRAGELSEPLGFLVSSPYNLSYEEKKAGNYMVQITTISKGPALKGFLPALEFPLTPYI